MQINERFVRTKMAQMGMGLNDFADYSGVTKQTILNMFSGKPYTITSLTKLANACNVDPESLLGNRKVVVSLEK